MNGHSRDRCNTEHKKQNEDEQNLKKKRHTMKKLKDE